MGNVPCSRAAHQSCSPENNKLYVYGGAIQNGGLAPDILHCLDMTQGVNNCFWTDVKTTGPTPGKRYGHSMTYLHPNIFIFGGNLGNKTSNDTWTLNLEDPQKLEWAKLEQNSECPPPRMYHTFSTCNYGNAKGMLIVFGGRGENNFPLNDVWGFRRHRDGRWDWTKAPDSKESKSKIDPFKRFQVKFYIIFYYVY